MTTAAPTPPQPAEVESIDEERLDAWRAYRNGLRELTGRDYEEAEADAWDRLQHELEQLERRRAELVEPSPAG